MNYCRGNRGRSLLASMLLATLMPMLFVSLFHRHHNSAISISTQSGIVIYQSDVDSIFHCPICNFIFSPQQVAVKFSLRFFVGICSFIFVFLIVECCHPNLYYYSLRAPPFKVL